MDSEFVTATIPLNLLRRIVEQNVKDHLSYRKLDVHEGGSVRYGIAAIIKKNSEEFETVIMFNSEGARDYAFEEDPVRAFMGQKTWETRNGGNSYEDQQLRFQVFALQRAFVASGCPSALLKVLVDDLRHLPSIPRYTSEAWKLYDVERFTWLYDLSHEIGEENERQYLRVALERSHSLPIEGEEPRGSTRQRSA